MCLVHDGDSPSLLLLFLHLLLYLLILPPILLLLLLPLFNLLHEVLIHER